MSGRSRRSTTWRFSISVADFGSSGKPQWPHAHASCRTTRSGSATCRNVPPSWPVWPPLALPERPRRLPGTRGFFFNPSLEGGLELFELSCPNCRRRSATSASSAAICRFSAAINSSTSAGRTIPPLIQIRPPPSRKIRHPTPIPRNRVTFRTHPGLGVTPSLGYRALALWILGFQDTGLPEIEKAVAGAQVRKRAADLLTTLAPACTTYFLGRRF